MSIGPFDYLNSINDTKEDLMVDDLAEKQYNPYMVNKGLSYFQDTVLFANEMNVLNSLPKRLQYDWFINTIRKRKRFSKWNKPNVESDIEAVKEYYGYSNEKARNVLSLLSPTQLKTIKNKVSKNGRTRNQ